MQTFKERPREVIIAGLCTPLKERRKKDSENKIKPKRKSIEKKKEREI